MLLDADGGEFWVGEGFTGGGAEEAIGLGEHVGFVGYGYEGGAVDAGSARVSDVLSAEGDLAGHGCDAE